MNEAEVIALIGPPLDRVTDDGMICLNDGGGCHSVKPQGYVSLAYFRPYAGTRERRPGPMLWVGMLNGVVVSVGAKHHGLWDSNGVYLLPASFRDGGVWESPDFEDTFPR